jgi:hypothetical protein
MPIPTRESNSEASPSLSGSSPPGQKQRRISTAVTPAICVTDSISAMFAGRKRSVIFGNFGYDTNF